MSLKGEISGRIVSPILNNGKAAVHRRGRKNDGKIIRFGRKFVIEWSLFSAYIALAQSRTCLWVSADPRMVRKSVRYLDLTAPVDLMANRQIEDILKQRRCGPF